VAVVGGLLVVAIRAWAWAVVVERGVVRMGRVVGELGGS
jgi:hypothetical protein